MRIECQRASKQRWKESVAVAIRLLPLSPSRTLRRDSLARTIIVRTMVRETLQHRTLDAHVYLTPMTHGRRWHVYQTSVLLIRGGTVVNADGYDDRCWNALHHLGH